MPQFNSLIELSSLSGKAGFRLDGTAEFDMSGFSVGAAGDVNGDGLDDIIVGAYRSSANGDYAGSSYVVYGSTAAFASAINLSTIAASRGFRIDGTNPDDRLGFSVAGAGDVNGDGIADVIAGALSGDPNGEYSNSGSSYVVFGKRGGLGNRIDVGTLNGANGFRIDGIGIDDQSGSSVASGNINGDNFDDLIIGAYRADPNGTWSGSTYVVFGAGRFTPQVELSALNGRNGFRLDGTVALDGSGFSVASAGDINGDGFDEVLVGAYRAGNYAGRSYVIFGKASGFAPSLQLASLNGNNGFRIDGVTARDYSGFSVASAGDVNGDGLQDIFIGARRADPGLPGSGSAYVVFGKTGGFAAAIKLSALNGANGFRLDGAGLNDNVGGSVASAGDVNGDGFDDLIVGAPDLDGQGPGQAYVVFGKTTAFTATLKLSTLNGNNGFTIAGVSPSDTAGRSVSAAGDLNGDGFGDLIVGAYGADPNGHYSGSSYVIFGVMPTTAVNRTGNAISQTIAGGNFNDTLQGLDGNDNLYGHGGNDSVVGGAGNDTVRGAAGFDTLSGGPGDDLLIDADNDDTLLGAAGIDRMFGGGGNDYFDSGPGADSIWGGAGNDSFAYIAAGWGGDAINDFADGVDQLRFKRTIADHISDFHITGNNTAHVVISIGADTLKLHSTSVIQLTNADFLFLA